MNQPGQLLIGSRVRGQTLATVLVIGPIGAVLLFDDEHRFAEHEHGEFRTVP